MPKTYKTSKTGINGVCWEPHRHCWLGRIGNFDSLILHVCSSLVASLHEA